MLPRAPVTFTAPTSNGGMKEWSLGVVAMMPERALTGPWRRWVEAGEARGEVCSKEKGAIVGRALRGPMPPSIGLEVGVGMLEDVVVAIEVVEYEETPISLLGGSPNMGCDVGSAEAVASGGAEAGRWGAGLLIPDRGLSPGSTAGLTAVPSA